MFKLIHATWIILSITLFSVGNLFAKSNPITAISYRSGTNYHPHWESLLIKSDGSVLKEWGTNEERHKKKGTIDHQSFEHIITIFEQEKRGQGKIVFDYGGIPDAPFCGIIVSRIEGTGHYPCYIQTYEAMTHLNEFIKW